MPSNHSKAIFDGFVPQIGVTPLAELLSNLLGEIAALMEVERVGYSRMERDGSSIQQEFQYYLSRRHCDAGSLLRLYARDYPGYFAALNARSNVIVSHDVMSDPRLAEFQQTYFKPLGITSMLDVPVHRAGQLYGVICHEHVGPPRHWTDMEVEAARSFAHLVALAIETDQRQKMEAAVRDREARYRAAIEHTPAAIVVLNAATGKFVETNDNAVRLFGLSREELLDTGPAELSPPRQADGRPSKDVARENIGAAVNGETRIFEWLHRDRSGRDIPCEIRIARMPAEDETLVIAAIMDITERKRAEAELRMALEQERELSELKTNFVNVVSHEFRTPLGVIVSSAEILEHYFERLPGEQRAGHLQDIGFAAQQMAGLMDEVLLLGRVDSGRMQCNPEPLDMAGFCRRLVDEQLSATHRKCPIQLTVEGCASQASADEALLRHVFNNLLSNAVKYSAAGSVVTFVVRREERDAVFEIQDHGIGIPASDQKRLFEAFHRGQNVGDIAGTGLGLVIAKSCVDLHSGTIAISSEPGKGTRVTVRLPLFRTRRSDTRNGATKTKRQAAASMDAI
ncbi:MAG TPA: ATP-binding protein [Verrucomicrobiae bacterium]|nr:ATP-binding protein [Verrucomicrobiae bacterium]